MKTHAQLLPILPHTDVPCPVPFGRAPHGDSYAAPYTYPAF